MYDQFGLEDRLVALAEKEIEGFESQQLYDLVLAEGFVNTLDNRDEMVPIVAVLLLMGLLIGFGSASGVGPFRYTLFRNPAFQLRYQMVLDA